MKPHLSIALAVLALALGGLAAVLLRSPADPAGRESAVLAPPRDAALAREVAALREEQRELAARVAMLEARPLPVQRAPVADDRVGRAEFDALTARVEAVLAGLAVTPPEPAELEQQVADALVVVRKQEAVEKVREYQQKRDERLDQDVTRLTDWLELDSYQSTEMRKALTAQYEREEEVRRLWEAGEDDELLGERKRAAGEAFGADLGAFLTPDQVERFWAGVARRGK